MFCRVFLSRHTFLMNKLETVTYYLFGWIPIVILRRFHHRGWFWGVDWSLDTDIKLVWIGLWCIVWGEGWPLEIDANID